MAQQFEQEAKDFVLKLQELYLVQRDVEALLANMSDKITWIGTGKNEISNNKMDAKMALQKEKEEYGGGFRVTDNQMEVVLLSDHQCIVYGTLCALALTTSIEDMALRFSLICEKLEDRMQLVHCHFSRPDDIQAEDHYYVQRDVRRDHMALRGALISREQQLEDLIRNIPCGAHQCMNDPNFTLLGMSDSFLSMFGYTREEIKAIFDDRFVNMIYPGDRAEMLRKAHEQLRLGSTIEFEYRVLCKNGKMLWILDKGRLIVDEQGQEYFYCVLIEIEERKRDQEELRLSLEKHKVILDQATDIIFEWDIVADTLDFSPNWIKKFGYPPIEDKISNRIPHSANIHPEDMPAFVKLMRDTAAGTNYSETEFRICDVNGNYIWNRIRATAQYDSDGRAIKAVGIITDIDEEKRAKEKLVEMAQRDSLTGLYNKVTMQHKTEYLMEKAEDKGLQAMMIIDVDDFKHVNDTYGHLCGDSLLACLANTLKKAFRSTDLVARIGGDEFMIYLPVVSNEEDVYKKAEHLLEILEELHLRKEIPPITCSVGIAVEPHKTVNYFALYQCADKALYFKKHNGKSGITVYNAQLCDNVLACDIGCIVVGDHIESEE